MNQRILSRVLLASVLLLVLAVPTVCAADDTALTITLGAPSAACPGETITFTLSFTNDEVERDTVQVQLRLSGRDLSEPETIFDEILSVPANAGGGGPSDPPAVVVSVEYTVPVLGRADQAWTLNAFADARAAVHVHPRDSSSVLIGASCPPAASLDR
jgi:hypothetical protein